MGRKKEPEPKLIRGSVRIRSITGKWSSNPRPRCGKCKGLTVVASIDRGVHQSPRRVKIGRFCYDCWQFYPLKRKEVLDYD